MNITDISTYLSDKQTDDVDLITLHWTVGRYDQTFDGDYHFQITGDGQLVVDSRAYYNGYFVPLAHAWHHNSRNVGISVCGMLGAVDGGQGSLDLTSWPSSYGEFPPTPAQISTLAQLVSVLVRHYGLTFDDVKSHYDLAQEDGYPGERWEYKYEKPLILAAAQKVYEETKP